VDPDPRGSALILAVLDPDPYWECGNGPGAKNMELSTGKSDQDPDPHGSALVWLPGSGSALR
jgi:hypothetical protein